MNIIIADSHNLCREALRSFLHHADQDISVAGVEDYAGLVEFLNGNRADILLLDTGLPGLSSMGNIADINLSHPELKVGLIVSDHEDMNVSSTYPAQGRFPKNLSSKGFLQGIQQIMAGEHFIPDDRTLADYSEPSAQQVQRKIDDYHLTTREKQVLSFLVQGATNKDIARALDLQVVTVKLHVRGICRKISAKNRTQAALIAQENGWH